MLDPDRSQGSFGLVQEVQIVEAALPPADVSRQGYLGGAEAPDVHMVDVNHSSDRNSAASVCASISRFKRSTSKA